MPCHLRESFAESFDFDYDSRSNCLRQELYMDARYQALCQWVAAQMQLDQVELSVVSGDASFRRYFRLKLGDKSWIAMDAPPEKEDSSSFVAIARYCFDHGLRVPEIIALDLQKGFLLLSDFGQTLLLSKLNAISPDLSQGQHYYAKALQVLLHLQALSPENCALPYYDAALLQREMSLFTEWFLGAKLKLSLSEEETQAVKHVFDFLTARALAQEQVFVHRDYHSRNLMICEDDGLAVLDFQDAVKGPLTYDLVSLLRDCYIVWPADAVTQWCKDYYAALPAQAFAATRERGFLSFKDDFDLMGLQRHIKVAGIFSRLSLRDGKHGYLRDIPLTLNYIVSAIHDLLSRSPERYQILQPLLVLIEHKVLPLVAAPEFYQVA